MPKSLPYISLRLPLLFSVFISSMVFNTNAIEIDKTASQKVTLNKNIIPAFKATYAISRQAKELGEATRKLVYLDDGLAQYSYHTDLKWLIFSDTRTETSVIKLHGNKVTPISYEFIRKGTGRNKHYKWRYDIANNTAINEINPRTKTIEFPDNIQDPLSYHLQHRLNMISKPAQDLYVYPVIKTSGSIKNYVYQYDGEEELILPDGLIKTLKFKREVIEKKRITYIWFAPELDYLLVKLHQIKGGVEQFKATLKSVSPLDATNTTQTNKK